MLDMESIAEVASNKESMLKLDYKKNKQCVVELARTTIFKKIKFVGRGDAKLPIDGVVAKLCIKAMGWGNEDAESNWDLYKKEIVVAINNKRSTCAYMMKDAFMCKLLFVVPCEHTVSHPILYFSSVPDG